MADQQGRIVKASPGDRRHPVVPEEPVNEPVTTRILGKLRLRRRLTSQKRLLQRSAR